MWYHVLLSGSRLDNPDIAKLCLGVVQTYIEWVDVGLFMTAKWIDLLYFLLTVPPLRVAACECLQSLVEKKQLPGVKMESLSALNVVDALQRMMSLFELPPSSDDGLLFIDAVAKFAVAVGGQLLALLDTCTSMAQEPSTHSAVVVDANGMVLQDRPFSVMPDLLDKLACALHAVVGQVVQVLELSLFDVRDTLVPLLQVYLKSPYLLESEAAGLLATLVHQTRIPGVAYEEDRLWDDVVIDQRKALHNLLRLLHRRYPDLVMSHLQSLFFTGLGRLSEGSGVGPGSAMRDDANFTDPEALEAALRYLYEMGESLCLDNLKIPNDTITQLLQRLLTTEAVVHNNEATCVHLAFFEVFGRYHLFFTYHPQFTPLLLQRLLLQPCGVMNSSDRVRARICYLFGSLLQLLKAQLGTYAADMVVALHSIVTTAPQLQPGDRRELYEAMGMLLSICSEEPHISLDCSSSKALRLLADSVGVDSNGGTLVSSDVLSEAALLLGRKAELMRTVVCSALHSLQEASASCSGMGGNATASRSLAAVGGVPAAAERAVADIISYLSALAKGLGNMENSSGARPPVVVGGGVGNESPSSPNGGVGERGATGSVPTTSAIATGCVSSNATPSAKSAMPPTSVLFVVQMFLHVTQRVMEVARPLAGGSLAVRDTVGQFFHQLINLLPYEVVRLHVEEYVTVCLNWMETVPELSRLLRVMFQYANKAGGCGVLSVARLTTMLWRRLCDVGELSEASPVMCMGVVSESSRERLNVYKQFFTFLFNVCVWGGAAAFALMPSTCWASVLRQLCYALTLPAELELPKSALQVLVKLTQELTESVVAQAVTQYGSVEGTLDAATAQLNQQLCSGWLLQEALPTALNSLTDPSFDLGDAKNFALLGEVLHLLRLLVARYGDPAMQVFYDRVAPYVGHAEALECCTAIRDQPRVNAALKIKVREVLGCLHASRRQEPPRG
ncbi:hypothetical protein JKF63_07558 [Porcisia hertigi]|uniref:Exportin-T n=1 Tax=Porcisia hertigi TaxID=2761500 RepID=A0A836LM11_9TRYP|nr:hypothetical protein JKF63_07558 [Porcisia hertigi]